LFQGIVYFDHHGDLVFHSRAGMAAGLAAVIFGQFVFGVIADTLGLAGLAPIPLDLRRIIGLAVMAVL
jgi:uncharacterized membrane protein YdcZ (DUF606 family)